MDVAFLAYWKMAAAVATVDASRLGGRQQVFIKAKPQSEEEGDLTLPVLSGAAPALSALLCNYNSPPLVLLPL